MSDMQWVKNAKCVGNTKLFFAPPKEDSGSRRLRERLAITLCMQCPVMHECRAYARENDELGIWGGETEDQRFALGYLNDPFVRRKHRARDKRARKRASVS